MIMVELLQGDKYKGDDQELINQNKTIQKSGGKASKCALDAEYELRASG